MQKIIGIGNALVDVLIKLENEAFLAENNLPKGSMQLVDKATSQQILSTLNVAQAEKSSGGSVANTIHGLAKLGASVGFIGTVGNDDMGAFFSSDMNATGITPFLSKGKSDTGHAIALITPDSERTFATYLGAAIELTGASISDTLFDGYDCLLIEGYLVYNHDLIETCAKIAKAKGVKVAIDLASFNVVEDNLSFLQDIVKNYVDIVFANEEEAKAFTGQAPEQAIDTIAAQCEIAVVKVGKSGSYIKRGDEKVTVGVIACKPIDTTGAGDLYAAGFLFGLTKGLPLSICGELGAILSGHVIEVMGAKMPQEKWQNIHALVNKTIA